MLAGGIPAFDRSRFDPARAKAQIGYASRVAAIRAPTVVRERTIPFFYEAQRPTRRGVHLQTPRGRPSALSFDQLRMVGLEQHGPKVNISLDTPPVEIWVDDPRDSIKDARKEGRQVRKVLKKVALGSSLLSFRDQLEALKTALAGGGVDTAELRDNVAHATTQLSDDIFTDEASSEPAIDLQERVEAIPVIAEAMHSANLMHPAEKELMDATGGSGYLVRRQLSVGNRPTPLATTLQKWIIGLTAESDLNYDLTDAEAVKTPFAVWDSRADDGYRLASFTELTRGDSRKSRPPILSDTPTSENDFVYYIPWRRVVPLRVLAEKGLLSDGVVPFADRSYDNEAEPAVPVSGSGKKGRRLGARR